MSPLFDVSFPLKTVSEEHCGVWPSEEHRPKNANLNNGIGDKETKILRF